MASKVEHVSMCLLINLYVLYEFLNWTVWTNKQNRDRLIDGEQMTIVGWRLGGGGIEQKKKKG